MATEAYLDRTIFLVLGALLAWGLQQYRVARAEDISLINDHLKDIDKFSDASVAYWLKRPNTSAEEIALSLKVHATWASVRLVYPTLKSICDVGNSDNEYERLTLELYSTATGGDFEVSDRYSDPSRALDVTYAASSLTVFLRGRRHRVISLARLGSNIVRVSSNLWQRYERRVADLWNLAFGSREP